MAPRAYWKGYLKLSLVSCPIALYPATSEREKISFNQLNKETGNRIRYRKVDAETGDEVEQSNIIKGYEVAPELSAREAMTPVELDSSALKSSIAFTGRLACMTRAEAFQVVAQSGGTPSETVTKRTKLLIVGELGWPLLDDGRPSNKLSRATAYGVPIVSERRFLEWIGKAIPNELQKTYSADQLASLSKLSGDKIQELAHLGLLDKRADRFGFRDLAGARQIAKLLAEGILLSEIISSVSEIRKWLPEAGLANVRLRPGPSQSLEVEQPSGRADKSGQFILAVDHCQHDPDALFQQAQAAEEAGHFAEAERLYRILMKSDPTDASAAFNLGNLLRAGGRHVEVQVAHR